MWNKDKQPMKRYPKYKDSGIEWIGEIPEHWERTRIKFLAGESKKSFVDGDWIELPYITEDGIRLIQTGNVGSGEYKEQGSNYISEQTLDELNCTEIFPNDILICRLASPVGRACLVPNLGKRMITAVDNCILKPSKSYNSRFIVYQLTSKKYLTYIEYIARGGTRARISRAMLGNVDFVAPPHPEQQSIANYLDRKTHQIDTLIENKQKLIDLLKEQRAAIINQVVTKGLNSNVKLKDSGIEWLGEIPEHWGIARLKFISNIKYGLGQPPRALEEGLPIIRATNIKEGKISPDDLLYVDPKDVPYDRDPILKENDIIVVRSGAYTGDSAIIPREYEGAVAGYDMVACVHKANPEYIAYSLLSHSILHNQIDLCRLRAAQPHLNAEELGDTLVFLPPNDEQKMIVEFIKHESEMIVSINQNLEELIKCLKEYRTALISEVVTGKIDVRDVGEQEDRPS